MRSSREVLTGWTFSGVSQVSLPKTPTRLGFTWTEGKTERKKLLRRDLASTAAPPSAGGDRPVCKEIGIRSGDANRKEYRNLDKLLD